MNNERKLIEYINDCYNDLERQEIHLSNEQKMLFETGVAKGITFALTRLININIDLGVLGRYEPD